MGKVPQSNLDLVGNIRTIKAEIARLQGLLDEARAELLHGGGDSVPPGVSRPHRIRYDRARILADADEARRRATIEDEASAVPRLIGGKRPAMELVAGSAAFWAAEAIRAAGRPLHMRDLVKAIEAQGHKVKPTTLMGSLFRWVKKKAVFYKAGKNTFGLVAMRK